MSTGRKFFASARKSARQNGILSNRKRKEFHRWNAPPARCKTSAVCCRDERVCFPDVQSMKDLKIGMIGAGMIAHRHCEEINIHPRAKVVAVADPNVERANDLKAKYELQRSFEK